MGPPALRLGVLLVTSAIETLAADFSPIGASNHFFYFRTAIAAGASCQVIFIVHCGLLVLLGPLGDRG